MRLAVVLALTVAACTETVPEECPSLQRPTARSGVEAVLVQATNQIYALGGQGPLEPLDELWRYSFGACGGWTRLVLASSPGARASYAAAFDDMRTRIVYIGGTAQNDVWSLDTDRLTFTKLAAVGNAPPVASDEFAAYDDMHDRIVYAGIETYTLEFGGSDQGQWVYFDGTSLRAPASAAVDRVRERLVTRDADVMRSFDFLTSQWIAVDATGDVPPVGATLVWDDLGQRILAVADGVWTTAFDANGLTATFTALTTTNDPPPRTNFAVAVSGTVLWLSGGVTASGCTLDDLWTLDLDTLAWTNVWPATVCG